MSPLLAHFRKKIWSRGQDLNLRQSGICKPGMLNDPYHMVDIYSRKLYQAELAE